MSDFGLTWSSLDGAADLSITANDLTADEGLETAVFLSLFLDRRAEPGDVLPDGETDRRGWWADALPVVAGDRVGSRLWLLARSKQTADVLDRAREYALEALRWLTDDRVASKVDVSAEFLPGGGLTLEIVIHRPAGDPARFRFGRAWDAQEARI